MSSGISEYHPEYRSSGISEYHPEYRSSGISECHPEYRNVIRSIGTSSGISRCDRPRKIAKQVFLREALNGNNIERRKIMSHWSMITRHVVCVLRGHIRIRSLMHNFKKMEIRTGFKMRSTCLISIAFDTMMG